MSLTCRISFVLLLSLCTFSFAADTPFDLVITNGHIIDGTGSPWYSGDIGIRDGRRCCFRGLGLLRVCATR